MAKRTGRGRGTRGGARGKKKAGRAGAGRRTLVDTGRDKRYMRRATGGQFKESDDVGRSLSRDVPRKARTKVRAGYGDRGDR
jgi:hypothetical protein